MKAFLIFSLLAVLLPAKTWIDLAKESDYHEDHPGRLITNPEDDPRRMEYLKLNAQTVEKIMEGESAVLPVDSFDFEKEPPTGDLLLALARLSKLTVLQAKRQEWNQVNSLFDLARTTRKRICASEPSLVWFLVAVAPSHPAFQCLEEVSAVQDRAKREAIFAILKSHWQEIRAVRLDFTLIEKGETRSSQAMCQDFKGFLRSLHPNLDLPPFSWSEEFPHQLTVREILDFPFDEKQFRANTLNDLKKEFQWIRSGKPIKTLRNTLERQPPRNLAFYRTHANGLGELMRDGAPPHQTATLMMRHLQRNRLQDVAWRWLSLERTGQPVKTADQVIALMPVSLRKELEDFDIKLLPEERLIEAPDELFFGQTIDNSLIVPKLFTK